MSNGRILGIPNFVANEGDVERLSDLVGNVMSMRKDFMRQLMDPRRDVYAECGYPRPGTMTAELFQDLYDNEAIPARVVELMPKETWRVTPTVYDNEGDEVTPFEEAWDNLGKQLRGEQSFYKQEEGSPVWEYLQRLDVMSGIGQYGVLLLGLDDRLPLDQAVKGVEEAGSKPSKKRPAPVDKASARPAPTSNGVYDDSPIANAVPGEEGGAGLDRPYRGPYTLTTNKDKTKGRRLLYMRVFPESLCPVTQWESNEASPRYGQPVMYQVTFDDPRSQTGNSGPPNMSRNVHWTRVIHVPSDGGYSSSEVLGVPRMRPVIHNLLNLQKMYGANGEGFWKSAFSALILKTNPAAGTNPRINTGAVRNMVEAFQYGLQRDLLLQNMDAEFASPTVEDVTPHKDAQIEAICIKLGVPVPVFKGYEIGEQASTNNDADWKDRLKQRQRVRCTAQIVIPTVDRLIIVGVLPEPKGGAKEPAQESLIAPGLPSALVKGKKALKTKGDAEDPSKLGTGGTAGEDASVTNSWGDQGGVWGTYLSNAFPPPRKGAEAEEPEDDEPPTVEDLTTEAKSVEDAGDVPEGEEDPGYVVYWPDMSAQSKDQKAEYASKLTTALAAYVSGGLEALLSPKDYLVRVCGFEEEEVDAILANTEIVKQQKAEEQAVQQQQAMDQQAKMIEQGLAPDPTDPKQVGARPGIPGAPPVGPPNAPQPGFPPKPPVGNQLTDNYTPEQPRDSAGRWTSWGGSAEGKIATAVGVRKELESHGKDIGLVLSVMPPAARKLIDANLKSVTVADGHEELKDHVFDEMYRGMGSDGPWWKKALFNAPVVGGITKSVLKKAFADKLSGSELGGGFFPETGHLALGPGPAGESRRGVTAHELSHVVDGGGKFSSTPEWKAIWKSEVAGGKAISGYAKVNESEGFAEFGRGVYSGELPPHLLATTYPRAAKFFKDHGLWPS